VTTSEKETQGAPTVKLRPGQTVGEKYRFDRLIGRGGMAVVWAGTSERTGKRVALKLIRGSFASNDEAAELFRREALAAGLVNHPNVVNVFDVIDHEGMTCIVMELLDGEPFDKYLARKGPLSAEEAGALLLPAMRGVAAAHAQGVIHRDLKPQNIFLCTGHDGRLVTTKVLDFGISVMMEKAIDPSAATVQLATLGTPAYMSPEHIAGAPNIDARADVYGFGVLFYEALAGQHPFPGPPGPELLMRILHETPRGLALFRPDLPFEVVHIIECAMAKDPKDRFPELDPFIRSVEVHLLPSSSLPRALTPLAGVPLCPLGESNSGVADSIVQVMRRAESSGLRKINETQALYTLARVTEVSDGEASRRVAFNRTGEAPAADLTPVIQLLGRFPAKRFVVGALFAAFMLLVLWLAFPGSHGTQKGPTPSLAPAVSTVHARVGAPIKAAAPVAELPTPAGPAESAGGVAPRSEFDQVAPTPTDTTLKASAATKRISVERNKNEQITYRFVGLRLDWRFPGPAYTRRGRS
jgi:serine/threonine protein kinase